MSRKGRWSAREIARRALRRVESQGVFASAAIDAELEAAPDVDPRERGLATELVYGTLRHRDRLDRALGAHAPRGIGKLAPQMRTILRVAAYQLLMLDRVPDHAAVDDAVRAARKLGGNRMAGFANAVLRKVASTGEPPLPRAADDPMASVCATYSLPRWIAERIRDGVGEEELVAAAAAFSAPAPLSIRVNPLRATLDQVIQRLPIDCPGVEVEPATACPNGLLVRGLGAPERSPSFGDGWWTVQDAGAQRVSLLAAPAAGMRILDACAGVGGKSTHLAELSGDRADILAVDVSERKLRQGAETAARLGLQSIHSQCVDLLDPIAAKEVEGDFDLVVVDAPCSGLGVLRRHPEAKWRVQPEMIAAMAELQARMLEALVPRVRPGGALVYAVCTFTEEEGPAQIERLTGRHGAFRVDGPVLSTWPHRDDADAFYAARLVRAP